MVKKISIVIAFFLLSTTFGHSNYNVSAEDEIPEWGFYVYMAGDNTLYDELTDDLNEMKMVGSNDDLNIIAPRSMAVIDAVKLIIENYPENKIELLILSCAVLKSSILF